MLLPCVQLQIKLDEIEKQKCIMGEAETKGLHLHKRKQISELERASHTSETETSLRSGLHKHKTYTPNMV